MSSPVTAAGNHISGAETIRQQPCGRGSCAISVPPRTNNCCDEQCLVEIALRECSKDGSHGGHDTQYTSDSATAHSSTCSVDNSNSSISKTRPCRDHYQQARDKYADFLDNLGCICKILLSLNIESCCTIPYHGTLVSSGSRSIGDTTLPEDLRPLCEPTSMQLPDDEFQGGSHCDTSESTEAVATKDSLRRLKLNTKSEKNCCSKNTCDRAVVDSRVEFQSLQLQEDQAGCKASRDPDHKVGISKENSLPEMFSCKKGCCDNDSSASDEILPTATKAMALVASTSASCCGSGSCSSGQEFNSSRVKQTCNAVKDDSLRKSSDVSIVPPKCDSKTNEQQVSCKASPRSNCCSGNGVCHVDNDCASGSRTSDSIDAVDPKHSLSCYNHIHVEIEEQLAHTDHVLVRVQGMDCTGCETKLFRSLATLPELSNITTSLLLAQAEFDIYPSKKINSSNILGIMEKMTGFTCSKIIHSGAELEFIVEGNAKDFLEGWPVGIKQVTVLDKHRVSVSYQPRMIGARDLVDDPFFRGASLAPCSPPPSIASGKAHLHYMLFMTLLSATLTIPVLVLAWGRLPPRPILYGSISLVLATIVQIVIARQFYTKTFKALFFSRMIDMDLLIVLSSSTAYIYSVVAFAYIAVGKPLETGQFFETSTLLITLIMVGRTVSAFARQKAVESFTIESLQTPSALLVDEVTQEDTEIDARLLQYKDVFKVLPEMSIVTDGIIISGESEVDESMVTGEANLIPKSPGSAIVAGSVNHSGSLYVKVTRLPCENTLKSIGSMVDEAKSTKPQVQEIADRVASYFVPLILVITLVVFVVWIAIGKLSRHQSVVTSAIHAMTYAISVLIVSCPCAIGLAVPMVVVIAGGVAARHGLIFKTAETIDTGRNISHVVFDKTGTLTQGTLRVVEEEYVNKARNLVVPFIMGLTMNSKHPVSIALAKHLNDLAISPSKLENITSIPGNGMEASSNGFVIKAGNPYWLQVEDHPSVRKILTRGLTIFCATLNDELVTVFGFQDILRLDALETITELQRRSIEISIISGDNRAAVESIALQLGVPMSNIRSRCSPEQKQSYVKSLLTNDIYEIDESPINGHKRPQPKFKQNTVLFIGDGTNDAPSLAQASIGLHISSGTDVAQSAADAVLMRPSLKGIITLIDLSKAFHRRVVFNFTWSFVYNLLAILLAAGVFGKARIPPQYAGLGEVVSVVPVVAIAVGLRWWKA